MKREEEGVNKGGSEEGEKGDDAIEARTIDTTTDWTATARRQRSSGSGVAKVACGREPRVPA